MRVKTLAELPPKHTCLACGDEKPVNEMLVIYMRRTKEFYLRPRCKKCHNQKERGHRRAYKTKYLRLWRKRNPELTESYWRQWQGENRSLVSARAYIRFCNNHHAILIQGRLRRRTAMRVSLAEATALYKKFGPCYPTRYGLTPKGLRECERIRSSMRRTGEHLSPIEIRIMLYEDGYYVKPSRQKIPYQHSSRRLQQWQASRRLERVAA